MYLTYSTSKCLSKTGIRSFDLVFVTLADTCSKYFRHWLQRDIYSIFTFFSLSIILNMIILQPASSSESSSQKSMVIGSMTFISIQFSLQYSFSILTTYSAFVHTYFVFFPKAASFIRKVVLFLATKPFNRNYSAILTTIYK